MGDGSASDGSRPLAPVLELAQDQLSPELQQRCDGFLARYFQHLSLTDLKAREPRDLLGAALAHLRLGEHRDEGTANVHVFNPDLAASGWQSAHTVVQIVTDDMPFLVDSVRMVMTAMGLGIHLVIHPMLRVRREECRYRGCEAGTANEAWIYLEVDRCDGVRQEALRQRLLASLDDVRVAVADWRTMRDRCRELVHELEHSVLAVGAGRGGTGGSVPALAVRRPLRLPRLPGVRVPARPRRRRHRRGDRVRGPWHRARIAARRPADRRPSPPLGADPRGAPHGVLALGADADDSQQPQHGVPRRLPGVHRREALRPRRAGWWGSGASSASTTRTSIGTACWTSRCCATRRPRCSTGLASGLRATAAGPSARSWRPIPATSCYRSTSTSCSRSPRASSSSRTGARCGCSGGATTTAASSPASSICPGIGTPTDRAEQIAEALREAYGGTGTEHEVLIGMGALARLYVRVALGPDVRDPVIADVEQRLGAIVADWADELGAALVGELGEDAGLSALARFAQAFPADYRDAYSTGDGGRRRQPADEDRGRGGPDHRLASAAGCPAGGGSVHPHASGCAPGAVGGAAAARGPRRDGGRRAAARDPRRRSERVALRHRTAGARPRPDRRAGGAATSSAPSSPSCYRGTLESDGLNELVLVAGLTARQVDVLRAYAKYLRQVGLSFSQRYVEETVARHGSIVNELIRLFETRFDPALDDPSEAPKLTAPIGPGAWPTWRPSRPRSTSGSMPFPAWTRTGSCARS